jgi:homoserine O-succinyltransferase
LGREYRRDVRRYLSGNANDYPALPQYYFRQDEADALELFRQRAMKIRDEALLAEFPAVAADIRNCRTSALKPVFDNWLCLLQELAARRHGATLPRIAKTSW